MLRFSKLLLDRVAIANTGNLTINEKLAQAYAEVVQINKDNFDATDEQRRKFLDKVEAPRNLKEELYTSYKKGLLDTKEPLSRYNKSSKLLAEDAYKGIFTYTTF